MKRWFRFILVLLLCGSTRAELAVARVFARGMVLQRDAAHPVFGTAVPGSKVKVAFAGQTHESTADAMGQWRVILDPMPANATEQVLTVSEGGKRVQVADVLVGDVWICVGDALMAQGNNTLDAHDFQDDPLIRQYSGRHGSHHLPLDDFLLSSMVRRGVKKDLKTQNLIALGFAKRLRETSGVPIYMFNVSSGKHGSHASWMSPQAHRFLSELNARERDGLAAVDPLSDRGREAYRETWQEMSAWLEDSATRVGAGLHLRPYPLFPNENANWSAAYNANLHPLRDLPVKGILWFSMIRDNAAPAQREERLAAMFRSWRLSFRRPDLPIYTAQLYDPFPVNAAKPGAVTLGEMRAATSVLRLKNTGVAVSHDLNEAGQFKLPAVGELELGRRMALWAEHQVYRQELPYSGPIVEQHRIQKNAFVVQFAHAEGLKAADGERVRGFYVAGADKRFKAANVEVSGAWVKVWSDEVPEPRHLTYATSNAESRANLVNRAGLPAPAFVLGDDVL